MAGPQVSTWLDLVVGVDIHTVLVPTPGGPVPTPLPHPYVGLTGDPIGAAVGMMTTPLVALCTGQPPALAPGPVLVNHVPAMTTLDSSRNTPLVHVATPPGTAFAKPPTGVGTHPLGALTVVYSGGNVQRLGEIVRSCSDPVALPTSSVITIPKGPPVLVGGPPGLNVEQAVTNFVAGKVCRMAWGAGTKLFRLMGRLSPTRLRNFLPKSMCWLTGHPVDIATGRVLTEATDLELPGPIPLTFSRQYSSGWAGRRTSVGWGWSHSLDRAVWVERAGVVCRLADGREIVFDTAAFKRGDVPLNHDLYDPITNFTLTRTGREQWQLIAPDGLVDDFMVVEGECGEHRPARIVRTRRREGKLAIVYGYDRNARLVTVIDCVGRVLRLENDLEGRLLRVEAPDPAGGDGWYTHVAFEYSSAGDLTAVADALGNSTRYEYDRRSHLMVRETDRNGLSFHWIYDGRTSASRCIRTWGDGGIFNQKLYYAPRSYTTIVVDSDGNKTKYVTNEFGAMVEVMDALGGVSKFAYDDHLKLCAETDPNGNTTRHGFDHRGLRTSTVKPDGGRIFAKHHESFPELETLVRTERGAVWRTQFDPLGQAVAVQGPDGGENVGIEWRDELIVGLEESSGTRTEYEYDRSLNPIEVRTVVRGEVISRETRTFDRLGRVTSVVGPEGAKRTFDYDLLGRLVRTIEPDGNVRASVYDPEGNVLEVRDGLRRRGFTYAGFNWLTGVQEAGTTISFSHEPEGELRSIRNERRHEYRFTYDKRRMLASETGFDLQTTTYKRDKAGNVIEIAKAGGKTTVTYDACGRCTGHRYADDTWDAFVYGPDGLIDEANNEACKVTFERDSMGRVVKEVQGDAWVQSQYLHGEFAGFESSLGARMAVLRDGLGDVAELRLGPVGLGAPQQTSITFSRNALGAELTRQLPGGLVSSWSYDRSARPRRQSVARHAADSREGTHEWSREYVWNLDDRLKSILDSRYGDAEYQHDARGRILSETVGQNTTYRTLDEVGNVYRTPDFSDRSFARGGIIREAARPDGHKENFVFDREGRMSRRYVGDDVEAGWRYSWDGAGNLVRIERPDGLLVTCAYDALGRRVSKTVEPADDERQNAVTTKWIWSGNEILHEIRDGAEAVTWYHDPENWELVARFEGDRRFTVVSDQIGTPTAIYDDNGKLIWQMQLELFGTVRPSSQTNADVGFCLWRWAGQLEDVESGLYYNRYRFYDPSTGTYLSEDPLRLFGGFNFHDYVHDPLTWIDPLGLIAIVRYKIRSSISPRQGPRDAGVRRAWKQEAELVRQTGEGTRSWSESERRELIETGKVRGFAGHHINNVESNPHWAGDPRNILFLTSSPNGGEHRQSLQGHRGKFQNQTRGRLIDREQTLIRHRSNGCGK